jgi:hypothetical protein
MENHVIFEIIQIKEIYIIPPEQISIQDCQQFEARDIIT